MYGAVANIGGDILEEININGHGASGEASFEMLSQLIQRLLAFPRVRNLKVSGIGVGAPGMTRSKEGVVEWSPSLNWRRFPLKEKLEEHFGLPVAVDNDVNQAALGESWFGVGQGVKDMVLIAIGTGAGAGIIIDGALYRGHDESAGEVGYMLTGRDELGKKYNRFGALESKVSGTGVVERARHLLAGERSSDELRTLTSFEVFDAARRNEAWACRVVADTVDFLSVSIANIVAVLNPELVILGGEIASSADLVIPPLVDRISGVVPHLPQIKASTLGYRAAVMGAIARIVYATTDYFVVRELV